MGPIWCGLGGPGYRVIGSNSEYTVPQAYPLSLSQSYIFLFLGFIVHFARVHSQLIISTKICGGGVKFLDLWLYKSNYILYSYLKPSFSQYHFSPHLWRYCSIIFQHCCQWEIWCPDLHSFKLNLFTPLEAFRILSLSLVF